LWDGKVERGLKAGYCPQDCIRLLLLFLWKILSFIVVIGAYLKFTIRLFEIFSLSWAFWESVTAER
jgi:hypothetical protein